MLTAAARTLRWTPDLVERNDLKIALGEFGGIWSEEVRPDDDIMGKIHSALDEVMLIDPGFIRGPLLDAANEVIADANARTLAG